MLAEGREKKKKEKKRKRKKRRRKSRKCPSANKVGLFFEIYMATSSPYLK